VSHTPGPWYARFITATLFVEIIAEPVVAAAKEAGLG
jgi:hypothetical protein